MDALRAARNYAFLLLKFRLRSERELYERLKKKKFEEGIIRDTLFFLKGHGFLDDEIFAKAWIQSRLKKPLGINKIRQELKLKGVDKEIVERLLGEIRDDYDEEGLVFKLAGMRFRKLKSVSEEAATRRVYAWLLRRGFPPSTVAEAISRLREHSLKS